MREVLDAVARLEVVTRDSISALGTAIDALRTDTHEAITTLRTDTHAAIDALRTETHAAIDALRTETHEAITTLRTDLMARMDTHANQLTAIRDDIAVATGQADSARKANLVVRNDIQFLSEQVVIMERQIQRLQTDVRTLKGDP